MYLSEGWIDFEKTPLHRSPTNAYTVAFEYGSIFVLTDFQRDIGPTQSSLRPFFLYGPKRGQPKFGYAILEQVIIRPFFHGFDRDILAEVAGNDDERYIQSTFLKKFKRAQAAKLRQGIVGQNQVGASPDLLQVIRLGIHAHGLKRNAGAPKLAQHEFGVVWVVLHDQDFEGRAGG